MSRVKRMVGRKAAKAMVEHSAHGVAAKVRRRPMRSASLLAVGAAAGSAAGFIAGRRSG